MVIQEIERMMGIMGSVNKMENGLCVIMRMHYFLDGLKQGDSIVKKQVTK